MGKRVFPDARFVSAGALEQAVTPVLELKVLLKLSTGGVGPGLDTGTEADVVFRLEPFSTEAFLYWIAPERFQGERRGFVTVGFPERTETSTISTDGQAADYDLLFPLTLQMVSQLEDLRAGDKARFRVRMRMTGMIHYTLEGQEHRVPFSTDSIHVMQVQWNNIDLEVERSRWVEEVLPGLGYGKWVLYDVPLLDAGDLPQVDNYLDRAHRLYLQGEYKSSMGSSRDAVEALRRPLKETANAAFTDEKGGTGEEKLDLMVTRFGELVRSMFGFEGVVSGLLSAGAHPEPIEAVVERADAEFALMVALACRNYAGLRLRNMKPPSFVKRDDLPVASGSRE